MNKVISIAGRAIGPDYPPYIIAEMSANHNGSLETAFRIIEAAKSCGADALKIQTYRPDTITLNSDLPDFRISGGLWGGRPCMSSTSGRIRLGSGILQCSNMPVRSA